MRKKPGMVASDIGGTLVHNRDTIPLFTSRVLNQLLEINIPVVLVTGYNYNTARKYAQNLNQNVILIVQNGAIALKDNKIIWEQNISDPEAQEIYNFLDKREIPIYVYKGKKQNFQVFYRSRGEAPKPKSYLNIEHMPDLNNTIGISTRISNEIIDKTRTEIINLIGNRFQLILSKGIQFSWLEITPLDSRKDLALTKLCQEMCIPISEVIYFGDNYNDLDALKIVGFPVLVKNAVPRLKENFNTIIKSSCQEGVALFLKELFDLKVNPNLNSI